MGMASLLMWIMATLIIRRALCYGISALIPWMLVGETHGTSGQYVSFSLVDAGSACLAACVVFFFVFFFLSCQYHLIPDYERVLKTSENVQCIWLQCDKRMLGWRRM
jgi:hypothetical protein